MNLRRTDSLSLVVTVCLGAAMAVAAARAEVSPELAKKRASFDAAKAPSQRKALETDLVNAFMLAGDVDSARAILDRVLKDGPDAQSYHMLALTYLARSPNDPDSAVKVLIQALQKLPDNVTLLLDEGDAYRAARDFKESVATFERILAKEPHEVRALYGEADTYLLQPDYARARQAAQRALDLDPKRAESLYYMGKVCERDRGPTGSILCGLYWYRKAIEVSPDARYYVAMLIDELVSGQIPQFKDTLNALKRVNPADAAAHVAEGVLLEVRGKNGEALAYYRAAAAQDSGCAFAHFALANYFLGTGNYHPFVNHSYSQLTVFDPMQAAAHITAVRFIDPGFPYLDDLEARLRSSLPVTGPVHPDDAKAKEAEQKWNDYFRTIWAHH